MVQAGQYVTDGTAVFLVTDIRDGSQVGDIKLSPILRNGYVKANGALLTSARANYPRLVQFITENPSLNAADDAAWDSNKALYVYDSTADTLRVPDATGRVLQGGVSVQSVEAGLPNVNAEFKIRKGTASNQLFDTAYNPIGSISITDRTGSGIWPISVVNSNTGTDHIVSIDASLSTPIYGSSTTVQPPALTMIPQIKY